MDHLWTSSVHFMSRTFSAALVTARRVLRRCFAVRTCSSSLTRIHQDLLHHTMCPLGTSFLSFSRMVTSSSLSRFPGALLALSLVFMRFFALSFSPHARLRSSLAILLSQIPTGWAHSIVPLPPPRIRFRILPVITLRTGPFHN